MRICLVGSCRHPIREPFAGGLEALTHALAGELRPTWSRGDALRRTRLRSRACRSHLLPMATFDPSAAALADRNAPTPSGSLSIMPTSR